MLINAVYLFTGALGGTIIGALGSGSSLVILPLLTITFASVFPETVSLKIAVATCMATLIVGSLSGAISYARSGLFDKQLVKWCLPGVLLGALIAPQLSNIIPAHGLRWYIGALIVTIAVYKLVQSSRRKAETMNDVQPMLLFMVSIVCAILSGLAGVALGILMIPFLARYAKHQVVLGTNLLLAVPYSIVGTLGYVMAGLQMNPASSPAVGQIDYLLGYIYLPAFFAIALTIGLFPPLGLKIAKKVGNTVMQRVFYGYLLVAGLTILF